MENTTCWKCNVKEVEAEDFDSTFRLICNGCAAYRTEKARSNWIRKKEDDLASCEHCLKSFRYEQTLEQHPCPRQNVIPCALCGHQLYSVGDQRKHTRYLHKIKQCEICGEDAVVNLGEHVCRKTFNSGACKKARKKSDGKKTKECKYCGKNFMYLSELTKHIPTHTGEKPYPCMMCPKKFTQSTSLRSHVRTHTGEKPHQCKICKKSFAVSGHLARHIRTHTGEKPHQCNLCERRFSQSCHLKEHKCITKRQKFYQCETCARTFTQSGSVKTHICTTNLINHTTALFLPY